MFSFSFLCGQPILSFISTCSFILTLFDTFDNQLGQTWGMCWAHKEELEKLKMLTKKLWHTVPTWLTLTTICKYLDVWLTLRWFPVHLNQMGLKHGLGNEVFPSFIVKYYNCTYTRKKILCLILNLRPPNLIMFTLSQLRNLWFVLFCFVCFLFIIGVSF